MSMHEVEDVLERAVRLLDQTPYPDLRTLYYRLFTDFATLPVIDIGFVEARVLDVLVKHRYAYRIGASERYRSLGYEADSAVYAFVGDSLWQRWIEDGVLTGKDAAAPHLTPDDALIMTRLLLAQAEKSRDTEFMRHWYPAFLIWLDFRASDSRLEQLRDDPILAEIMQIVVRSDASTPPGDFVLSEAFSQPLPTTPDDFVTAALRLREDAD